MKREQRGVGRARRMGALRSTLVMCFALPLGAKPVPLLERIWLEPEPAALTAAGEPFPLPARVAVSGCDDPAAAETMAALWRVCPEVTPSAGAGAFPIRFTRTDAIASPEGYELSVTPSGIVVRARTAAGECYGAQTLYQMFAYAEHGDAFLAFEDAPAERARLLPRLEIRDEPAYPVRAVMADLGRAPWSPALLERLVRIMGQLKLNTLHLHLYDDQLCGFRFRSLPLGRDNPFALDAGRLRALVAYARRRHIAVVPELESWGHVGSIVSHYPELRGGEGMYGGASFAAGERTFALLAAIYDEVVPCLEPTAVVHVGLDEAKWAVLPGAENAALTPTGMVARIHETLMQVAARHHRTVTMQLWADHGGRPLPPELEDKVIIEPWQYLGADAAAIRAALQRYGGAGRTPLMMGAGANSYAYHGGYEATRIWCEEGRKYPNVRGVTLCLWESNDLAGRLVTLYGGAGFAWAPGKLRPTKGDAGGERLRQQVDRHMRSWQLLFPEALPDAIDRDRGPEVKTGRYVWPPRAGQPVSVPPPGS